MSFVECIDLKKKFGDTEVLRGLSFELAKGRAMRCGRGLWLGKVNASVSFGRA